MFSRGRDKDTAAAREAWVAEPRPTRVVSEKNPLNFLLGPGCKLTGKLILCGESRIDGAFAGEITASGVLTIGESGLIEAIIHGETVRVLGQITGDIECSKQLELSAGARVLGNITSPSLVIQDGVLFEGHCSMPNESNNRSDNIVPLDELSDDDSDAANNL